MSIFATDSVGALLADALDGYSARQTAIADNIANVDTPNFTARNVEFETSLREAVDKGTYEPGEIAMSSQATDTPYGENGNNVDLRKEVMAAAQTTFTFQILTRAASDRFANMKTAGAMY